MSRRTVQVELDGRGGWMIELPGKRDPIACETFKDAQRVGYLCAAQRQPCELLVHDAYHRVVYRTLVSCDADAAVRSAIPDEGQPEEDEVDRCRRVPFLRTKAN